MNISKDAMIIMYSRSTSYIQDTIDRRKGLGLDYDKYKRDLEIIEKAWEDYLVQVSKAQ